MRGLNVSNTWGLIILTSDFLWSSHIESICTKLLGLLFHRFYKHAEPSALLHLYHSLVRPHLEDGSNVWDPHLQRDVQLIENVQKFGLRICSKQWDLGYDKLLSNFSVPNFQLHRLHHIVCTMFRIVHNSIPFPSSVFVLCLSNVFSSTICSHQLNHLLTLTVFCTHLYLVLFPLGIHCHLTILMHLLYLHLKNCIHALKFCK